jgi:tetratricopeptide (TPR) repeat protein
MASDLQVLRSRRGTPKRVWVLARVCAGLAALSAQPSALAASPDSSIDFRCQGGGRAADEMIDACDRVIASGGGTRLSTAQALMDRANHLATKHEYDKAIEDYNRSIALGSGGTTAAFFNRGLAYVAKGDDAQAIQDFDEQIRRTPSYDEAFYQRGMIWMRRRQFDAAICDFDAVISFYDSFADKYGYRGNLVKALYRRGQARLGIRDLGGAIDDFGRAVKIEPWIADFHAIAHWLKGD